MGGGKAGKKKKDDKQIAEEAFEPLIIESRNVATVTLLLSSPEEAILLRTCEAIYKYEIKPSGDINKQELVNVGIVVPLLNLVNHPNKLVRRFVSMALGELSDNVNARKILLKANCLPAIRLLLLDDDVVTNEFAALWLGHMSVEYINKSEILEQNCIQPLISHLVSTDPDVQKNSVEALSLLLHDFHICSTVREYNAFPALLDMLVSDYPIVQELALTCLYRSTHEALNREAFRNAGGLDKIIEFISDVTYRNLHVQAMQVLSNCLQEKESVKNLFVSGGLVKILAFALETKNSECQQHATKAVTRALKNNEIKLLFHEKDVEKTFISIMSSDDLHSQIVAAQALAIMAESVNSRESISSLGGIEIFTQGIVNENEDLKEACSLALANCLINMPKNCIKVVKHGSIMPLIHLLGSSRENIQVNAINCFINMSKIESIRQQLQEKNIIPALCGLLKSSNPKIQSDISLCLSLFVTDENSRAIFSSTGAIETLVKLIASHYPNVSKFATWAVGVICTDEKLTEEACQHGVLEILQDLMKSQKRKNCYVDMTYERILDNNLSVKFMLRGHLSANNIIRDGFYDPGPISSSEKIPTLEELYLQEPDFRRPVILVNAAEFNVDQSISELDNVTTQEDSTISLRKKDQPSREASFTEAVHVIDDYGISVTSLAVSNISSGIFNQDNMLQEYIMDIIRLVEVKSTVKDQVIELARYVSEKMGGPIQRGRVGEFITEVEINNLKLALNSNVIPIGMIPKGNHYHRALLFKVLADRLGIPCSLFRGKYNRSWNEVLLIGWPEPGEDEYPPVNYVIDLIYKPGHLIHADTAEASAYLALP